MKLRNKTLLIIGATIVTLTILLSLLSRTILLDEFDRLQAEAVQQNLRQALKWMDYQRAQLDTALGDWAPWDDSYQFVQDGNQAYIQSNLVDDSFINLRLNLIVFVDTAGKLVYARAFDLVNNTVIPLPADLTQHLSPDSPLLDHTQLDTSFSGILSLAEMPVLVASQPIVKTNYEGEVKGTLIFGRYLDTAEIQHLSDETELHLEAQPLNNLTGEDFVRASQSLSQESSTAVYPLDAQTTAGYALLPDIYGQPGLILRVETPNKIAQQGQASFAYFITSLLVCGLAVALAIVWLLEKYVLSRLTALEQRLSDIHVTGSFDKRVDEGGSDELSGLARSVNLLLESIEKSQHNLQSLNAALEHSLSELRLVQEQKDRFFTHAGHEFRTPLANLRTRLYLTRRKPDHLPAHLDVLDHVADQMTTLVEDVFDVARYSKHIPKITESDILLQELVRDVVDEQARKAAAKDILFAHKIDAGNSHVYADMEKLRQALTNILTYILNFTPSGRSVDTSLHTFGDEAIIRIECEDIQLKPESALQLFQPFFRASEGGAVSTGLSLTLAKEIIELHFGRLSFEENGNGGGTFTIKLLLIDKAHRQRPAADSIPGEAPQTVRSGQAERLLGV